MSKKELELKLEEYKKKGYSCSKHREYITCPSGLVYSSKFIYGCPICDQFLEDNPSFEKVECIHTEKDLIEIGEAKKFYKLIQELSMINLGEIGIFLK